MKPIINKPSLWKSKLPKLKASDNKYTRGHLLINGSGLDCTGATRLAAFAAARAGAGMVTVACDKETLPIYQRAFLSVMAKPIKAQDKFFKFIKERKVKAALIGPGNGLHLDTAEKVLECLENKKLKLVLDADAISVFEKNKKALIENLHSNCILTPHEGEFKRVFDWVAERGVKITVNKNSLSLDGRGVGVRVKNSKTPHPTRSAHHLLPQGEKELVRLNSALNAAKLSGAVIVLKGHDTIIASPTGKVVVNVNAPNTLATAGSGDVLAGIISGLFVAGMPAFEAACAGVYIHAECARKFGRGLIAEDIIEQIPNCFSSHLDF